MSVCGGEVIKLRGHFFSSRLGPLCAPVRFPSGPAGESVVFLDSITMAPLWHSNG